MTEQTQVIMFCVIGVIGTPLAVFVAIKTINKLIRPPVNTLIRSGDIELVDYIEPSRPQQVLNYPDLHEEFSWYETIPNRVHSYISETPPSYHTNDRFNIYCCLENSINLDFILFILIIMFLLWIFFKIYLYKRFFLDQLTKIFNKINILWLVLIIICYQISLYSSLNMSLLLPFSLFEIDFRESFEWKFNSYWVKPKISYLKIQTLTRDINALLNSLEDDINFSMGISYISSYNEWTDNKEKIEPLFVDDAIIVNKDSNPILITEFILRNLNDKGLFITNWLKKDYLINSMDPVILTVTVAIEVKFK